MSTTPEVYPIWKIENEKRVTSIGNKKKVIEITQQIKIKIIGLRKSETKTLISPDIRLQQLNNSLWYLVVEPKVRQSSSGVSYFGLFLHLRGKSFERFSGQIAKFEISLFNTRSGKTCTKSSDRMYFTCSSGWGWKYFIEKNNVFENSKRSLDLNLMISITLVELKDLDSERDSNQLCSGDYQRCDKFAFNHDFMNDREYCDVRFVVEDLDISVHSKLLAQKSEVFKTLFSKKREISITELDSMVFCELISFIYKGYSPNIEKYCKQLLIAANYYQISQLRYVCDNLCFRDICPEEAIEALIFAIKQNTFSTKTRVVCYIAANLDQVMKASQEKWKHFTEENTDLVQEIMEIAKMKCQCSRH